MTTALTASGMALVVFVFAATLMLADGLQKTLVETGSPDNVVIIRKGAQSEIQSGVERLQASIVSSQPEIAIGPDGSRMLAQEMVVLINLLKRRSNKPANMVIRGIGPNSLALRPQVQLTEGRMPRPGSSEIITGSSIARNFQGTGIGEHIRFGMRDWNVVGIFEAGTTGFNSEIWGDSDQLMQAFRRPVYSSLLFRLADTNSFDQFKQHLESDPRLKLEAKREPRYYLDQSEAMATFLRILGLTLTLIFSLGAIIGAMITMYAAVANRVAEIGTLRALGFQRSSILVAFLSESLLLGLAGGLLGVGCASFMQLITISTMNWQTFSELAFSFHLTPGTVLKSLGFSLVMGFVGGLVPALQAARLSIVDALRGS
jgi:ABC-type lipoprotein release transport system permease subunit